MFVREKPARQACVRREREERVRRERREWESACCPLCCVRCSALLAVWRDTAAWPLDFPPFYMAWDPHSRPAFHVSPCASLIFISQTFLLCRKHSENLSHFTWQSHMQQMKTTQLTRLFGILLTVVNCTHLTRAPRSRLQAQILLIQKQNRSRSFKCSR